MGANLQQRKPTNFWSVPLFICLTVCDATELALESEPAWRKGQTSQCANTVGFVGKIVRDWFASNWETAAETKYFQIL